MMNVARDGAGRPYPPKYRMAYASTAARRRKTIRYSNTPSGVVVDGRFIPGSYDTVD
jgi:hypothetical protein